MYDLIKFELKRIKSSPLFYVVLGLPVLFGVISGTIGVFYQSSMMEYFIVDPIAKDKLALMSTWSALSGFYTIFPIMGALYVTLFVGNDMSSGFLRNKLIAGHKRSEIYFSYLITQTLMALLEVLIYALVAILVLVVCGKSVDFDGGRMFIRYLVPVFAYVSMIFLYTAFTLAVRKRALPIVFSAIFAFSISSIGLFATFGNYPVSQYNKFLSVSERAKADINFYLEDNPPSQPVYADEDEYMEAEYEEDVDFYFEQLLTPNKPFYYVTRTLYTVTDAGILMDYGMSILDTASTYNEEMTTSLRNYVEMEESYLMAYSDVSGLSSKINGYIDELEKIETTVPFKTLDAIYLVKTFIWSCIWIGGGFLIFRKKNIF